MKKLAELLDATVIAAPPPAPAADGALPERHLGLDRGYDYEECRAAAAARGYTAHIPPVLATVLIRALVLALDRQQGQAGDGRAR